MDTQNTQNSPAQDLPSQRLSVFVGQWLWEASIEGQPFGNGRSLFERIEESGCLIVHEDSDQADFPAGITIVGADDETGAYSWLQSDSRGICRIYQMSLADGVWKYWREAPGFFQRFIGAFSDDNRTITGRVEQSRDGTQWETDFDLTYRKVESDKS